MATIPVSLPNGKSGHVKIPLGSPPGSVFYYKEKDIFQKSEPLHPVEAADGLGASVAQPAVGYPTYGQPPITAAVVSVVPAQNTGIYPSSPSVPGYYPDDRLYSSNAVATAPAAVIYENNSTRTGFVATSQQAPRAATYRVEVPMDARPGQTFHCVINGQKVAVVVPPGAYYGTVLTLQGPAPVEPSAPPVVIAEYADIPIAQIIYCEGVYYNGYTGPAPSAPPQQYC